MLGPSVAATTQDRDGLNVGGAMAAAVYQLPEDTARALAPPVSTVDTPLQNGGLLRYHGTYADNADRVPFRDPTNGNVLLDVKPTTDPRNAVKECATKAIQGNFPYFGVEKSECRFARSLTQMTRLGEASEDGVGFDKQASLFSFNWQRGILPHSKKKNNRIVSNGYVECMV